MNALIARALALALVVAVWTAISHLARLPLLLWPVIVGVACFLGSGGGVAGAQKSALSAATGVVWGLLGYLIASGLGRAPIVDALIMGLVVFGIVAQGHVPLLSYAAGTLAAAATAVGTRVGSVEGALQTTIALLIGVGLGLAAEYGAGMIKPKRK